MRILVVEDDKDFASGLVKSLLQRYPGSEVAYSAMVDEALTILRRKHFDFVLIDLMLPPDYGSSGLTVLSEVRKRIPTATVFLMTSRNKDHTEVVAEGMAGGAAYFFDKNSSSFTARLLNKLEQIRIDMSNRVFLSHGRNELAKLKLKDFLRARLGQDPVILAEQPSRGLTVVEKLEEASNKCSLAIILLTKDDVQQDGGMRARQNVIHEVGFFQGKYGRQKVLLLCEHGVEIFSNISGIIRIEFDSDHFEECFELIRIELEAAGMIP
jgi:CheY-like chemotaxis protein